MISIVFCLFSGTDLDSKMFFSVLVEEISVCFEYTGCSSFDTFNSLEAFLPISFDEGIVTTSSCFAGKSSLTIEIVFLTVLGDGGISSFSAFSILIFFVIFGCSSLLLDSCKGLAVSALFIVLLGV